jgi:superoxide dismutase, Cu-Zn family
MERDMIRTVSLALIALGLAGCATDGQPAPAANLAAASLAGPDGKAVGTAAIMRRGADTMITVTVTGTPGAVHGMHLHAIGKCEAPAFTSAGPHLNPGGHQHGKDNPMGAHLGDLPNVTIDARGIGSITASLGQDGAAIDAALHDADGTAIVLHAAADDYRTDPTGNSGARIACGVIRRI